MPDKARLPTLDALRGVAALSVMWFHFTAQLSGSLTGRFAVLSIKYGGLGVITFFVISGFVIPYAMLKAKYSLSNYGRFILRRVTRLDPPYLLSIVLIVAYQYWLTTRPSYVGGPFRLSLAQTFLHVGYLNAIFGYDWFNYAFWSLAIEFQYYLLIGLLVPVLFSAHPKVRLAGIAALLGLSFVIPSPNLVFSYWSLFLLGIVTLYLHLGMCSRKAHFGLVLALAVLASIAHRPAVAVTAGLTALVIAYVRIDSKVLTFVGLISYSLYLLHSPIGLPLLGLSMGRLHDAYWSMALTVTATMALAAAYYWLVEKPSQRLSSRFSYHRIQPRRLPAVGDGPAVVGSLDGAADRT